MYQIIFIYIMLTNDPYEYVLFLDVIVHIYAEKPNKFKIGLVPIGVVCAALMAFAGAFPTKQQLHKLKLGRRQF